MENISKLYLVSYGHNSEENVQKRPNMAVMFDVSTEEIILDPVASPRFYSCLRFVTAEVTSSGQLP